MALSELQYMPMPSHLYLPLVDAQLRPLKNCVQIGESVSAEQCIARGAHTYLHTPAAGFVEALVEHPYIHHQDMTAPTLVVRVQGEGRHVSSVGAGSLAETLFTHGVVGMGGAGFSTARKCVTNIHSVLFNAMECEPEIKADEALMLYETDKMLSGIRYLCAHYPDARFYFCIEDTKLSVIERIKPLLPEGVTCVIIPSKYPSGAERTLVRTVLGLSLPVGVPASALGILCLNIGTVSAIADAMEGHPLITRIVTVTDESSGCSHNIRAPIGVRVRDVLSYLGLTSEGKRLSQGGSYMPTPIHSLDAPLTKMSNAILLRAAYEKLIMPCIRCSACVPVCPEGLLPQQLYAHLKSDDLAGAQRYHLEACITCGACDAVCPSHIPLANLFAHGKESVKQEVARDAAKKLSETRYTARESRTARLAQLREQKRELKREALSIDEKKDLIAAALARVQARRDRTI